MKPENMPKAVLRRRNGSEEEVEDISAYFFYLRRVAQRTLKQFKSVDELDAEDIKHILALMNQELG